MRPRNILHYPTGKEFKKYLQDDHEWLVITDTRLKTILAIRGEIDTIPGKLMSGAFKQLIGDKKDDNTFLRVYNLHTHPKTPRGYLSDPDWNASIVTAKLIKDLKYFGIIIEGSGVIAEKEIYIVKFPEDKQRLEHLQKTFPQTLEAKEFMYHFDKRYNKPVPVTKRVHPISAWVPPKTSGTNRGHEHALTQMLKENPDIKIKKVRKTHRFNMMSRRR